MERETERRGGRGGWEEGSRKDTKQIRRGPFDVGGARGEHGVSREWMGSGRAGKLGDEDKDDPSWRTQRTIAGKLSTT